LCGLCGTTEPRRGRIPSVACGNSTQLNCSSSPERRCGQNRIPAHTGELDELNDEAVGVPDVEHALDGPFREIAEVGTEKEDLLVELAKRAVEEDEADVLILAGAPLSGLAERVADRIPVPVIDQVVAAVKQVEALHALRLRKASAGTFRRPDAKPSSGLASPLAARLEHRDV